jgi:transcriptional regulator with XRE-family HTH domain
MRDPKAIGRRLREARVTRQMSQSSLAQLVEKSKQTISAWELGDVELTVGQLVEVSSRLGVSAQWLLLGVPSSGGSPDESGAGAVHLGNGARAASEGDDSAAQGMGLRLAPRGVVVPHLKLGQIVDYVEGRVRLEQVDARSFVPHAISAQSLTFDIFDDSMAPELMAGDVAAFDPQAPITPGSIVGAVIYKANGKTLKEPQVVVREIRQRGVEADQVPYDLHPASSRWPVLSIVDETDCVIIGKLVSFTRIPGHSPLTR